MQKTIRTCDIKGCGQQIHEDETNNIQQPMQVIFETEQEEGRTCQEYLSMEKLDICASCMRGIIDDGRYIKATGAMGYNEYRRG